MQGSKNLKLTGLEETSWRKSSKRAPLGGGQVPEGAVAPDTDGRKK